MLTAQNVPAGTTASFSPNPVALISNVASNSTLTIATAPNAKPGDYMLDVSGDIESPYPPQTLYLSITP